MQANHQIQQPQSTDSVALGMAHIANSPTPLAIELLKFVGGGKGASTTTIRPSSPKSGW